MSPARWTLDYAGSARRDLKRLDPPVRGRVIESLENLATHGAPEGALVRLRGRQGLRLRVGDWRVLLELDAPSQTIRVRRILPRGRAYDR